MADTTFVDKQTVIEASWLNEVNDFVYTTIPGSGGAAAVGHRVRTVADVLDSTVRVRDFGATGDGSDATAAFEDAITHAKTLTAPHLVIDAGSYLLSSTVTFDLPHDSTIDFIGTVLSSVSSGSAIVIGSVGGNTFRVTARGIKLSRTSNDYSGDTVGVELLNLAWAHVDIRSVTGFRVGVMPHGNGAGCTYNNVFLGQIHDNRTNVRLSVTDAAGGGYCNENNFFGGSLNHSSSYDVVTYASTNLVIDHNATNTLNNNRFWGISLEDGHPTSSNTVAATLNGANNVLYSPRVERIASPATYEIQFTANSTECAVLGRGFSLLTTNIDDLGGNTQYETREGLVMSNQVEDDADKAVLSLKSTTTSSARLLLFRDSGGNSVGSVKGDGTLEIRNALMTNLVTAADDAAAAALGVAVNQFYRDASSNIKCRIS